MAANNATISALHADGVVKDGDKLFNYSFNNASDAVTTVYDVLLRKHPTSGKPVVVIVKKKVAGTDVSDSTQYVKSAEFLRDLKVQMNIAGVTDAVIESIAALVMTSAELTAAGTPVDSQLSSLPTGIDMAYETYTSNTLAGYLRAKAGTVVQTSQILTAADPTDTGIDWGKVFLYTGIGTVVTIAGILIWKAFKKPSLRVIRAR